MANGIQYPSVAQSMQNALTLKNIKLRNILGERELQDYEADRESKRQTAEIERQAKAIDMAFDAKDPEQAKAIISHFAPEIADNFDMSRVGDTVDITWPGGPKITGPVGVVRDAFKHMGNNPAWWLDPQNVQSAIEWCGGKGVSIDIPGEEKPKEAQIGALRRIQKGSDVITQEYTGDGWVEVGRGPKFKPSEIKEPEKVWVYHPKTGIKQQIREDKVDAYLKAGWIRGVPASILGVVSSMGEGGETGGEERPILPKSGKKQKLKEIWGIGK